eukprot:7390319-Prymnesium_polylepis.1
MVLSIFASAAVDVCAAATLRSEHERALCPAERLVPHDLADSLRACLIDRRQIVALLTLFPRDCAAVQHVALAGRRRGASARDSSALVAKLARGKLLPWKAFDGAGRCNWRTRRLAAYCANSNGQPVTARGTRWRQWRRRQLWLRLPAAAMLPEAEGGATDGGGSGRADTREPRLVLVFGLRSTGGARMGGANRCR